MELDLGNNDHQNSGVKLPSTKQESPQVLPENLRSDVTVFNPLPCVLYFVLMHVEMNLSYHALLSGWNRSRVCLIVSVNLFNEDMVAQTSKHTLC